MMHDHTGDELVTSAKLDATIEANQTRQSNTKSKKLRARTSAILAMALTGGLLVAPPPARAADRVESFIAGVAPMAQEGQRRFGVPASVAIAQAILESGWGESTLSTYGQAYFGVKCSATPSPHQDGCINMPTWEVFNGVSVTVTAPFRTYSKVSDSFLDHGHFLRNNSRYAPAFQTNNADDFARAIHRAGYATDPAYSSKLINIMNANNLRRFDDLNYSVGPARVDYGIGDYWRSMNGVDRAALGNPRSAEMAGPLNGARMVSFNSGIIAWHPTYGSHAIVGKIWDTYRLDVNVRNSLGLPISDRVATGNGWQQNFEKGRIVEENGRATVLMGHAKPCPASAVGANLGPAEGPAQEIKGGSRQNYQIGEVFCTDKGNYLVHGGMRTRHRTAPWIGLPTSNEYGIQGGALQHFQDADVYWLNDRAITVRAGMYAAFKNIGGEKAMGRPLTDEQPMPGVPDGSIQKFEYGEIQWTPRDVRIVRGGVWTKYQESGAHQGLGRAVSDEIPTANGVRQQFVFGEIFWTPKVSYTLRAGMYTKYNQVDGAKWLGQPLSDEIAIAGGTQQKFESGDLHWSNSAVESQIVFGGVRDAWRQSGRNLGAALSPEIPFHGGVRQQFQDADVYWTPEKGGKIVGWGMRTAYNSMDAHRGQLGLPISNEYAVEGGAEQVFEGGILYYDNQTAQVTRQAQSKAASGQAVKASSTDATSASVSASPTPMATPR